LFFTIVSSIAARRLHQREQFIDSLLRDLPHAIGIFHSGDVNTLHHRSDLVAKFGEKPQGIARLIGDARDQACDQDLRRKHASVQFIHDGLRLAAGSASGSRGDMNDARTGDNRNTRCAIWNRINAINHWANACGLGDWLRAILR
jgi:hypothetical protein